MTDATKEVAESIRLFKKEGSSDKEYTYYLEPVAGGWNVRGMNGPRNGTLRVQPKTKTPVAYAEAKEIYDKEVKTRKEKKGYTEDEAGTPYQGVEMVERFTGVVPQLLNEVDDNRVQELLRDDDWVLQHKHNGHRRLIDRKVDAEVVGIRRNGKTIHLPLPVVDEVLQLPPATLIDGEMMTGPYFVAFDQLEYDGRNLRGLGFIERHALLTKTVASTKNVRVAPIFVGTAAKIAEFERIRDALLEGVVLRRKNAVYTPGRPNSGGDAVKYVFFATSTFIVMGITKNKRSVEVGALDDKGNLVSHGKVTVPVNMDVPVVEDLVDVSYMHAFLNGGLHISKYERKRDDIDRSECTMAKVKYKPEDSEPDDEEQETTLQAA